MVVIHIHLHLHALAQTLLNLDELRRSHTHNIHKDDHTILCDSSIGRTHRTIHTHTHKPKIFGYSVIHNTPRQHIHTHNKMKTQI